MPSSSAWRRLRSRKPARSSAPHPDDWPVCPPPAASSSAVPAEPSLSSASSSSPTPSLPVLSEVMPSGPGQLIDPATGGGGSHDQMSRSHPQSDSESDSDNEDDYNPAVYLSNLVVSPDSGAVSMAAAPESGLDGAPDSSHLDFHLDANQFPPSVVPSATAMHPLGDWEPELPFPHNNLSTASSSDNSGPVIQSQYFFHFQDMPPVLLSNPNPTILGSENFGLVNFLRDWAHRTCRDPATASLRPPHLHEILHQANADVDAVTYHDLRGDQCDMQGLNWTSIGTTRTDARARRHITYKNYVNNEGTDARQRNQRHLPVIESFFRFKKMTIRRDVGLAHFQLRSVLACPSRTRAYYPCSGGIRSISLTAEAKTEMALNLNDFPATGGVISTLDAGHGVLMGGTLSGDYCLRSLDSADGKALSQGQISPQAITNHLCIHTPRQSGTPVASIASNDGGLRVLDLETEKLVSQTLYRFALNSSVLSPDKRLRAIVGDDSTVLIVNADSGQTLQELSGHRDYGFACDWSDNGWTVATGFQDRTVKIWDARKWCDVRGAGAPLHTIRSEMAGVRGLRFSPLGSGRPVLVAAEEADFINLIDACTFSVRQTLDVFSEIGGIAFANQGQDLNILCCDTHRGGLLQLERCMDMPYLALEALPKATGSARQASSARQGDGYAWRASHGRIPSLLEGLAPF